MNRRTCPYEYWEAVVRSPITSRD